MPPSLEPPLPISENGRRKVSPLSAAIRHSVGSFLTDRGPKTRHPLPIGAPGSRRRSSPPRRRAHLFSPSLLASLARLFAGIARGESGKGYIDPRALRNDNSPDHIAAPLPLSHPASPSSHDPGSIPTPRKLSCIGARPPRAAALTSFGTEGFLWGCRRTAPFRQPVPD